MNLSQENLQNLIIKPWPTLPRTKSQILPTLCPPTDPPNPITYNPTLFPADPTTRSSPIPLPPPSPNKSALRGIASPVLHTYITQFLDHDPHLVSLREKYLGEIKKNFYWKNKGDGRRAIECKFEDRSKWDKIFQSLVERNVHAKNLVVNMCRKIIDTSL